MKNKPFGLHGFIQYIPAFNHVNPHPAEVIYLNFQPLEVVSRYRDPQLQVAENYKYLINLNSNICKS